MSRIEMPLKEYQGMKEKIEELEKSLANAKKEAEIYAEKYRNLLYFIDDVSDAGLLTRIFAWKKLFKQVDESHE